MKKLLIALLPCLAGLAIAATPVKTNGKLPENQQVTGQTEAPAEVRVEAMFIKDEVVSEVVQGNWIVTEHLITYKVIGEPNKDVGEELKFICKDSNPAPESGIMVKKMAWPFDGGSMIFHLSREKSCQYMPYFNIVRYEPLLRDAK